MTDISFIGEGNHDYVSTKYGITYNCHKFQLMTQTMKRICGRRMRKPSLLISLVSQLPEKTKNTILKKKLSEKIKAKLKLIPQQNNQQNPNSQQNQFFDSTTSVKLNLQILEFLVYLLFEWKQIDDKTLHELALKNEPRKATKDKIKP